MTLATGTVAGSYRVEDVLGRGGMAVVYRARNVEQGREVALKMLGGELSSDPEFAARFQREGRLQASLEHPHVVTVYEAGESEHGLYLAMRLIRGSTLAALMEGRALDARRALALLAQVADALETAHAARLVHRDVKPQNVLVGDSDDAYLGDFGITRLGGATSVTAPDRLMGTVSYLAPEVIKGGEATPASDRYAFAAMVFECLTGTAVYPRTSQAAVLYAHTNEPPPRISRRRDELPRSLDGLFDRALSKDPGRRPDSAIALVAAVRGELEGAAAADLGPPPPPGAAALGGATAEPLPRAAPAARPVPARRLAALLAVAALAGAAVSAGVAAVVDGDEDLERPAGPPPLAGARVLGSDLAEPGDPLDCRARRPRPSSPGCTVVQAAQPGRTLVVPEDGVVRRWAVRSARGELSLAVIRPRGAGAFQVATSRNEFAGNDAVHVFDANLAVERGDQLGVVVLPGSAVGGRAGIDGATTRRWIPRLAVERRADLGPGSGFDRELLLRVEYVPRGEQRRPRQVTGAAAARLPPGRVRTRRSMRFRNGRPVGVALVALGQRFVLDQFIGGRRTARIDVPDFNPREGRIITFEVAVEEAEPAALGIFIEYAKENSSRIIDHFYVAFPREFDFVD
jgi:serine/threonine-protein kinase